MVRRASAAGAVLAALLTCPCAVALNPSLDINQYAHSAWTIRDGYFNSPVYTIAQTPDGYLWLGTEFGLVRFDGVQFVPWQPPAGEHLPSTSILSVLAPRDRSLWIGTLNGLANWKNGKLIQYSQLAGYDVASLLEAQDGTIWVGTEGVPTGSLCAIHSGVVQCYGQDGGFGRSVRSLYRAGGYLWVLAETGLWQWAPGPPKHFPMSSGGRAQALNETGDSHLLIATHDGVRELVDDNLESYRIRASGRPFKPHNLLRDRDGGLWVGTADGGLLHIHRGRTDRFALSDGLSGDDVVSFFEDREGNIWVATPKGLDRFRDIAVPAISEKQGLSNDSVWSVLAARDGSVWLGTRDGLNKWNNGQVTIFRGTSGLPDDAPESLFEDDGGRIWAFTPYGLAYFEGRRFVPAGAIQSGQVHAITGDHAGNLWLSEDQSLLRLVENRVVEQTPWSRLEAKGPASALLPSGEQAGLWLGFRLGRGVVYFKDGQIRQSYRAADGLGGGAVAGLKLDPDGALWAATEGGLSRIKNGRVTTLTSRNGLPCDAVHWVMEDDDHSFWLYMACGLVHIARAELEAWAGNPERTIQRILFDSADGVRLSLGYVSGYGPRVTKSGDGKLWFVTLEGAQVIDPRHLAVNKLPPPVHIEKIVSDRETRWQNSWDAAAWNLRLPALSRDLQIVYTALSLVAPEKVRFKYKLEGHDRDWTDAGTRRQAFYNDLDPHYYRFRVIASNNSGVWNETGDSLEFSIAPAYYQTTWFRLSVVASFLALLAGLYQLRLRYLKHEFNLRLEGRVGERARIARDLHDTILQSFQGTMLQFSALKYLMPERPDLQKKLEGVCEQAQQAIDEGRDTIQGLRSSTVVVNNLARAISTLGEGLAADHNGANCPEFRVHVEGKSRDLPPLVRDEVYRIACETLRNAFRHAQAQRIEVEIRYDPRQFRLRVVDNGKGIDPAVLSAGGRAGHHGLPGINERAELAGGKLSVWSRLDSGTEIELTIPASIAYTKPAPARRRMSSGQGGG
jgi:signal transduction histidine kinase/ligand-binding sensor domain-containing protein